MQYTQKKKTVKYIFILDYLVHILYINQALLLDTLYTDLIDYIQPRTSSSINIISTGPNISH